MTQQHVLRHVKLQLARSKEYPAGSVRHGYDIVAPLDAQGRIDPGLWREHRAACRVRRFWNDEEDLIGHLVHRPGGAEHARWMFDYGNGRDGKNEDEEAGYRFGAHRFVPGEYVSISGHDGELHTFLVATVESLPQ